MSIKSSCVSSSQLAVVVVIRSQKLKTDLKNHSHKLKNACFYQLLAFKSATLEKPFTVHRPE
jgi:hypothetical protein